MHTCIREVRRRRGVKQKDLARRIGKSPATVSKYEQGHMEVTVGVLCAIAVALDVPVAELIVPPTGHDPRAPAA